MSSNQALWLFGPPAALCLIVAAVVALRWRRAEDRHAEMVGRGRTWALLGSLFGVSLSLVAILAGPLRQDHPALFVTTVSLGAAAVLGSIGMLMWLRLNHADPAGPDRPMPTT